MGCKNLHINSDSILRLAYLKKVIKPLKKTGDYYPFGLKHSNYNQARRALRVKEVASVRKVKAVPTTETAYKYKYNGKELQDEFDLNMYDLGARGHDPARVNFGSIDPRAEEYYSQSPYVFASNNPVFFVDINGEGVDDDYVFNQNGEFLRIDKNDKPDKLVIENTETGDRNEYDFNDPETDVATINYNLDYWGCDLFSEIKFIYTLSPERIQEMMKESDVSRRNWVSRRWYALTESVGGKIDFSVYHLSVVLAENETDHLWDPTSIMNDKGPLFIPPNSNTTYNLLDQGNYLWGSAMNILGFTKNETINAAKGYNKNDSNADIKAVKSGFSNYK